MTAILIFAALLAGTSPASAMEGARLRSGSTCYTLFLGDKVFGATSQAVTAVEVDGKPFWDVVVHQSAPERNFDMRDHFVLDRKTLLPVHFDSQRGTQKSAKDWHHIALDFDAHGIHGVRETATETTAINVPLTEPTWEGDLWGLTFAALPLRAGGAYELPYWQYDKGFSKFVVRVVGSEDVDTPTGKVEAWVLEVTPGSQTYQYLIGKRSRQELGYSAGRASQRLSGACEG